MSAPRPRSVTLGCVYGGLGGVLATVMLFETLQGWGSLEMQESLRTGLGQIGSDAEVESLLPALRWAVMVLMVGAIAATVFSFHAAKGHQASRVGLSVLAGVAAVTFVASGVAGLLPAVLAGLIIYLLWSAPAREWFAVVNGRTPLSLGATPSVSGPSSPPGSAPSSGLPPHRQESTETAVAVPPAYDPANYPEHAQYVPHATAPAGRPRPVTLALVIAGVGSACGAVASGLLLLVLVALRDQVVGQYAENDMLARQLDSAGITAQEMVTLGTWLFGVWFVVSVLGLIATGWAATGQGSGWWALLMVSILTAGCAALGLPIGLLWIAGAIVVIVQLAKPDAKAWFRRA